MIRRNDGKPTRLADSEALAAYVESCRAAAGAYAGEVLVCGGTGCRANHALDLVAACRDALAAHDLTDRVRVRTTGCHGFCSLGPLVVILPAGILYVQVQAKDMADIVATSVAGDGLVTRLSYRLPGSRKRIAPEAEIPFYAGQERRVFAAGGRMDPTRIEDYLARGGYQALAKALTTMSPEQVVEAVEQSGLRGRGGGGFATGRKWRSCREASGSPKVVICNGDEGDPGAFMDRSVMEGNPHAVLEGMAIGAYGIGASEGYLYVRHEYPLAVENLQIAIDQARAHGLLGRGILGTDFGFDVRISRGAGAFVCGEETALMASIEGLAGEPRAKHIHTTERGVFGRPTTLNNVETWVNVPLIIAHGPAWFAGLGSEGSKGTKVFSVVGKVRNTGLVEVPMGTTLREIVFGICGGVPEGRRFKGVQTGGPSGGCLPEALLDEPVDFDGLTRVGSMMGSGGMIVLDDHACVVELARYYTEFLTRESCGKCTACREGTEQIRILLERIVQGAATPDDLDHLERLGHYVRDNSICGLGKSAPNPVLSTLRYFREEYEEHVTERRCRAGVCRALTAFSIDTEACRACGKCRTRCPTAAIAGARKVAHTIDATVCIRCGVCRDVCPFDAVRTDRAAEVTA